MTVSTATDTAMAMAMGVSDLFHTNVQIQCFIFWHPVVTTTGLLTTT